MTLKQDSVTNFTEIPMRYYFTGIKLPDQLSVRDFLLYTNPKYGTRHFTKNFEVAITIQMKITLDVLRLTLFSLKLFGRFTLKFL